VLASRRAVSAIASFTGADDSTLSTSRRRVDRSGPITASRMRLKCVRSTRDSLRTVRSGGRSSATTPRMPTGGANCTSVSRPLSRIASRRRKRPTSVQFSENSTENQPLFLSGARPTKIDTGISCTSSAGSRRCASSSRASESEWLFFGGGLRLVAIWVAMAMAVLTLRRDSAT
jgi:hypothetical protein